MHPRYIDSLKASPDSRAVEGRGAGAAASTDANFDQPIASIVLHRSVRKSPAGAPLTAR